MSQRNVPHAYLCVHDDLCDDWYVSSTVLSKFTLSIKLTIFFPASFLRVRSLTFPSNAAT